MTQPEHGGLISWAEEKKKASSAPKSLFPALLSPSWTKLLFVWNLAARRDCLPLWGPKHFLLRLDFIRYLNRAMGSITNVVQVNTRNPPGWQSLLLLCGPLCPGCLSAWNVECIEYLSHCCFFFLTLLTDPHFSFCKNELKPVNCTLANCKLHAKKSEKKKAYDHRNKVPYQHTTVHLHLLCR